MSGPPRSPSRRGGCLSLVERGWRGARECSLALNARGIDVTHLVKGVLEPEVLAMIRPYPYIRLVAVSPGWFRPCAWRALVAGTLLGRWAAVLVDHERTGREIAWWCRLFGLRVASIRETGDGYELWIGHDRRDLSALVP